MIKIIFFDIDWTIYDHKVKSFNMKSLRAIKKAQKLGVKIFICTSRSYHSVETLGLFAYLNPDGLITSNGSLVIIDDEIVRLEEEIKKYKSREEYVAIEQAQGIRFKSEIEAYVDEIMKEKAWKEEALRKFKIYIQTKEHPLTFGIRPEDVHLANEEALIKNSSKAVNVKLEVSELLGNEYHLHTSFGDDELIAKASAEVKYGHGGNIAIVFDLDKYHLFDDDTTKVIKIS